MLAVKNALFIAVILGLSVVSSEARSLSSIRKIAPNWVKPKTWVTGVNRSYIDCFQCDVKKQLPKTLVQTLLDSSVVDGYKNDYWVYQNQVELRQKYGQLNSPKTHYQLQLSKFDPQGAQYVGAYDQNLALSESIKNKMISRSSDAQFHDIQTGPAARSLEESAAHLGKVIKSIDPYHRPAEAQVTANRPTVAATKAKSVDGKKSSPVLVPSQTPVDWLQARVGTKSDLIGMRGQIFMKSTLLNSEVDLVANRPLTDYVSGAGALGGKLISKMNLGSDLDRQNAEFARFRLYRDVPLVDVHASWMYGVSSQTMTSSLSKQFTSFLRAEISRVDFIAAPGQYDQRAGLFLERSF